MNFVTSISLVVLGAMFLALLGWGSIRAAWRNCEGRRGVFAALAILAAVCSIVAQKPSPDTPTITVDALLRDVGCYATNNVFHAAVTNAPSYAGVDFSDCDLMVYARERASTDAASWFELTPRKKFSQQPADYAIENATNFNYMVYLNYVPPSPVHTNGVFELYGFVVPGDEPGNLEQLAAGFINSRAIPPPPTARDYVQDGLIAMWDGIENAGWGTHDASATVWKDLVGGFDATPFGTPTFGGDYTITSDGYWVLPNQILGSINTGDITAEAVFRASGTSGTANQGIIGIGNNRAIWLFFGNSPLSETSSLNWQYKNGGNVRAWFNMGAFGTDIHTSTMMVASNLCNCFLDSVKRTITEDVRAGTGNSTGNCDLGRVVGFNRFYGETYNIRIYSRALSADEIRHNYNIDKRRFNLP